MDENDYRNFQSKKPSPEPKGRKTKSDYAREREERAAELALSLFNRKKGENGGYAPARRQEGLVRHSKKTSIPDVAGRGPEVKLVEHMVHPKHKPFSFALEKGKNGAEIYYGQLLVAICQSALSMTGVWEWNSETEVYEYKEQLRVTQQEIPNPMIYVPVNLDTEDLLKPTKLDWFGDVFLQWKCDENAVMNPEEVKIVGPTTPTAVPIPAYENAIPTDPTECLYFIKIGNVPEEGDITQNHASDVFWQPQLIRGGGTGF